MCVIILLGIELAGCSGDGGIKPMDSGKPQATVTVDIDMKADFLTSSLTKPVRSLGLKEFVKIATCPAPQPAWEPTRKRVIYAAFMAIRASGIKQLLSRVVLRISI